jgi:hypothetical protein
MSNFTAITDFTADKFTATKWDSTDKKATFAKLFIRFVQADFARSKFPKTFYQRLSMTFGHIAHFNQHGFYETFFTTAEGKVRFLRMTLAHPCYGDPAWTYSDVERALQTWLEENGVLSQYEQRLAEEQEVEERATLARLQAKYRSPSDVEEPPGLLLTKRGDG